MLQCMRTTIVFDPDVAAELRSRCTARGGTLRQEVNRLVRLGLAHERRPPTTPRQRFSTPTFDTGRPLISLDDVEAAVAHADGDEHR